MTPGTEPAGQQPFTLTAARQRIAQVPPLPARTLDLASAYGHVLAEPLRASCPVGHYAAAAMDGYAVNTESAPQGPWIDDGLGPRSGDYTLAPGHARSILTGGAVPPSASTVIRREHTRVTGGRLELTEPGSRDLKAGANIRPTGQEVQCGDELAPAGVVADAATIACAAVAGADTLECISRPIVGFCFTGDEVITAGLPAAGQVRDAFSPYFPQIFASCQHGSQWLPAESSYSHRIGDDFSLMCDELATAATTVDVVVTTGGTGFSQADHLRSAVAELGGQALIPEVAMRPGHPSYLARLAGGAHGAGCYVLGLPGNPLAAIAGLVVLGMPLLAALSGVGELATYTATAGPGCTGDGRVLRMMPVRYGPDGVLTPSNYQGSAMMRGLLQAQALAAIEPDSTAGQQVPIFPLPWARFNPEAPAGQHTIVHTEAEGGLR